MANRHMKRCSTSLVTREMQIKTTVRYYFIPTRIAIVKKKKAIIKKLAKFEEIRTLVHCWWECKTVQLLWETIWQFLKNFNMGLPYDPAILLLSIYPKELQTDTQIPVHQCSWGNIHNSQKVETMQVPITDEWINKMWSIHAVKYYSSIKRNEILKRYYNMDEP